VWVKGNALIVAGVQGTQPKVSPAALLPRFWGASKSGISLFSKAGDCRGHCVPSQ